MPSLNIDTIGNISYDYKTSNKNEKVDSQMIDLCKIVSMPQSYMNGYTVNAKAEFTYTVQTDYELVHIKKSKQELITYRNIEQTQLYEPFIVSTLNTYPRGNYLFKRCLI